MRLDFVKRFWFCLETSLQQKRVRRVLYVITGLASILFIGISIRSSWAELQGQKWQIQWVYGILAVVLYPLGMVPTAAAWHWLLKALGVKMGFRFNLRMYALSALPKHIPGVVWYVGNRTMLYQEHGVKTGVVLAATAAETALLALCGLSISFLFFISRIESLDQYPALRLVIPISITLMVLAIAWMAGGSDWLNTLLRRWWNDSEPVKFNRPALWISLGWMFLAWVGGGSLLWMMVRALTPMSWQLLPAVVGIWGMAGAVSLTIGILVNGMGLREVTLVALLSTIISPLIAVAVAVAFRLAFILGELLWVSLIVLVGRIKT